MHEGTSLTKIAQREGHSESHLRTRAPLACLSPRPKAPYSPPPISGSNASSFPASPSTGQSIRQISAFAEPRPCGGHAFGLPLRGRDRSRSRHPSLKRHSASGSASASSWESSLFIPVSTAKPANPNRGQSAAKTARQIGHDSSGLPRSDCVIKPRKALTSRTNFQRNRAEETEIRVAGGAVRQMRTSLRFPCPSRDQAACRPRQRERRSVPGSPQKEFL